MERQNFRKSLKLQLADSRGFWMKSAIFSAELRDFKSSQPIKISQIPDTFSFSKSSHPKNSTNWTKHVQRQIWTKKRRLKTPILKCSYYSGILIDIYLVINTLLLMLLLLFTIHRACSVNKYSQLYSRVHALVYISKPTTLPTWIISSMQKFTLLSSMSPILNCPDWK